MNDFGYIDYRKPIGAQNDYRTSTYRGHINLVEQIPTKPAGNLKNVCTQFKRDVGEEQALKSEQKEKYIWKPTDPYFIRNPTVNNVKFMKPFEEIRLRMAPKQIQPMSSVCKQDFQLNPKAYEEHPPVLNMRTAVEPVKNLLIIRGQPGYAKLLDPSATTSNLAYMPYTTQQLTIAAKDNITFWNWKKEKTNVYKVKETMCELLRSSECPKRHAEFPTKIRYVPNSGLTTESRSNYIRDLKSLNFDITHIKNKLMSCPEAPMKAESENNIYGSGKRIQKFIH